MFIYVAIKYIVKHSFYFRVFSIVLLFIVNFNYYIENWEDFTDSKLNLKRLFISLTKYSNSKYSKYFKYSKYSK